MQFIAKPTGSEWLLIVLEIDKDMMLQFHGNIGMILSSEANSLQLNRTEFALQSSRDIQSQRGQAPLHLHEIFLCQVAVSGKGTLYLGSPSEIPATIPPECASISKVRRYYQWRRSNLEIVDQSQCKGVSDLELALGVWMESIVSSFAIIHATAIVLL